MDINNLKEWFSKIDEIKDLNKEHFKYEIDIINNAIDSIVLKQELENNITSNIIDINALKVYYDEYIVTKLILNKVIKFARTKYDLTMKKYNNNINNKFIISAKEEYDLISRKEKIFNEMTDKIKVLLDEDKEYYFKNDERILNIISLENEHNKTCYYDWDNKYNSFNAHFDYVKTEYANLMNDKKESNKKEILKETIDNLKNMKPNKDGVRKVIDKTGVTCFYSDNGKNLTKKYMMENVVENTLPNSGKFSQVKEIYKNKNKILNKRKMQ